MPKRHQSASDQPSSDAPSAPWELLAEGKYLKLVRRGRWEFATRVRASGAIVVAALTPENRLLLTEQFRPPVGAPTIELPAGLVGDEQGHEDEELLLAAQRELLEETGYDAGQWRVLCQGPSTAGMADEIVTFFEAWDLTKVADGGGVDGEDILVHEVPLTSIDAWLLHQQQQGRLVDYKIYAALYFLQKSAPFDGSR